MSGNLFLDEIRKKKAYLRSQNTIVTSINGVKFLEKIKSSGEIETIRLGESSLGFVVDEKPDFQVTELLPFLLLSSQDVVHDHNLLQLNNVTHVLSIGIEIPFNIRLSCIKYKKIDLLDLPEAKLLDVLGECFQYIDEAIQENKFNKVLVHCNAGYSRAPSIVIAYLMNSFGFNFDAALHIVRQKRNIRPNDGFMNQLKQFETINARQVKNENV